jgi:hypothetical protein
LWEEEKRTIEAQRTQREEHREEKKWGAESSFLLAVLVGRAVGCAPTESSAVIAA